MEWDPDLSKYPEYWKARLKRGFGMKSGLDYRPWLRVRDVPSMGTSSNVTGITIPRRYDFLSTPETIYFHLLDRQPDVVDIREQFPILHLVATQTLCAEHKVKHPHKGHFPEPFTLDFLVTRKTESGLVYQARSVKTVDDAQDPATQERLNIEFQWCSAIQLDWKLVDVSGFTTDLLSTLLFMRAWSLHGYKPSSALAEDFSEAFMGVYEKNVPLNELIEVTSKKMRRSYALAKDDFRYCAWRALIPADICAPMQLNLPLILNAK